MTAWPTETLEKVAVTDDLHIAPHRADGSTGTPTWARRTFVRSTDIIAT